MNGFNIYGLEYFSRFLSNIAFTATDPLPVDMDSETWVVATREELLRFRPTLGIEEILIENWPDSLRSQRARILATLQNARRYAVESITLIGLPQYWGVPVEEWNSRSAREVIDSLKMASMQIMEFATALRVMQDDTCIEYVEEVKDEPTTIQSGLVWHGKGIISVNGMKEYIDGEMATLIKHFAYQPVRLISSKLQDETSISNISKEFAKLKEWKKGILAPYIKMPGRSNRGAGYFIDVTAAE